MFSIDYNHSFEEIYDFAPDFTHKEASIKRQRLCHVRLYRSRDQRLLKVETEVETS